MNKTLRDRLMTRSDAMACVAMAGILGAVAVGSTLGGCSVLKDPCAAVAPQIIPIQAKLADVQRALAEVERTGIRDALSDAQKAVFDDAMTKAWAGYEIAVQSVSLAADACGKPDISSSIAMIVEAWTVIRQFVGLFGGEGTPYVTAPMVWVEAQ